MNTMNTKTVLSISGLLFLGILMACKHDVPQPEPSNDPTVSENCSEDTVYFQNDILPLLVSNCAMSGCHDEASSRDGIILTDYVQVMSTGSVAAGNSGNSDLMEAITENDPDKIMPPPGNGSLTGEQINLIQTWINQGALNNSCASCDTTVFTFGTAVWPIIENNCQGCHTTANAGNNNHQFNNWSDVVADSTALWNSIMGTNQMSLMPKNTTGLSDCQKTIIRKWLNDGAPNN
jgi:uncharacterized membrane protein